MGPRASPPTVKEEPMRYFVISDPHGFYTLTRRALAEQGFFDDPHHKLIL